MKITLHNTSRIVELATQAGATMPARVWEGHTTTGIPVIAFITRIAAEHDQNLAEFEAELQQVTAPTADVAAWPARMLID